MQYLRAQVHYHRLPCTTCTTYTLSRVCLEWQLCLGYTCLPGKHTLAQDQAVIQLGLTACLARGRPVGLETRTLFNVWMLAPWRFPWKVHEENATINMLIPHPLQETQLSLDCQALARALLQQRLPFLHVSPSSQPRALTNQHPTSPHSTVGQSLKMQCTSLTRSGYPNFLDSDSTHPMQRHSTSPFPRERWHLAAVRA